VDGGIDFQLFDIYTKTYHKMKITQTGFPSGQFIAEEEPKKQIYIHHTAGNADPFGVFTFWASNRERIATCVTIGGKPKTGSNWQDGEVVQGFSSKYWAYHLGLKESNFHKFNLPYKSLDKNSIGIEICNWGQLTLKNGNFYNKYGEKAETDVAKAIAPECELEIVGIRPGEKIHEEMITSSDSFYTYILIDGQHNQNLFRHY
jgi:hypothetical protein